MTTAVHVARDAEPIQPSKPIVPIAMMPQFVATGESAWTPVGSRADRVASRFVGVAGEDGEQPPAPPTSPCKLAFTCLFWAASWFLFLAATICYENRPHSAFCKGNEPIYAGCFAAAYSVSVLLSLFHRELHALMEPRRNGVLHIVNKIRRSPRLVFWIECYHYETRTTTTTNAQGVTTTSTHTEKVVTHSASQEFAYTDWYDASTIHLPALEVAAQGLVRLHTKAEFQYADSETQLLARNEFNAFFASNKRDTHQSSGTRMNVGDCPEDAIYGEHGWCSTNATWYVLAIVLGFGPLYRLFVVARTATASTKILKVVRAVPQRRAGCAASSTDDVDDDAPVSHSSLVGVSRHRAAFAIIASAICITLVGIAMSVDIGTINTPQVQGNIGVFGKTKMCGTENTFSSLLKCHHGRWQAARAFACIALGPLVVSLILGFVSEFKSSARVCRWALFLLTSSIFPLLVAFATSVSIMTTDGCTISCGWKTIGNDSTSFLGLGGVMGPAPFLFATAWVVALLATALAACVFHPDPEHASWFCEEKQSYVPPSPITPKNSGKTIDDLV